MDNIGIGEAIKKLSSLKWGGMYLSDFLLTWEKTDDELAAVFAVADILRGMRRNNLSARIFDSGLAVSIFRDNSTRTRFSFASASNLLVLALQDLDEGKSQIAHGETVRETVQHGLLHGRGDRDPRRHVHRQGQRLQAGSLARPKISPMAASFFGHTVPGS